MDATSDHFSPGAGRNQLLPFSFEQVLPASPYNHDSGRVTGLVAVPFFCREGKSGRALCQYMSMSMRAYTQTLKIRQSVEAPNPLG